MPNVAITEESPRQDEVITLINELDAYLSSLYPAESNTLLAIDALEAPSIRFFVARRSGTLVGCGAMSIHELAAGSAADGIDRYGEVKRMYVHPNVRGMQIGRRLLERIEDEARQRTLPCLRLEAGIYQPEALSLYQRQGFRDRGPFGEFQKNPHSVFMEKSL